MDPTRAKYTLQGLNALAEAIYNRNLRKGFYAPEQVRDFDGMIANVHGEASEALEEWRKGRDFTETYWTVKDDIATEYDLNESLRMIDGVLHVHNYDHAFVSDVHSSSIPKWIPMTPELLRRMPNMVRHLKPEGIPSELADIIIRVLDICGRHGIDIESVLADKMVYNETRPYRHGGKRS